MGHEELRIKPTVLPGSIERIMLLSQYSILHPGAEIIAIVRDSYGGL
jgi:hypothetical protein